MFSPRITAAITHRVLREIFRDARSLLFLLVAPGVLIIFVRYLFDTPEQFAPTGAMMLGTFPMLTLYLVGSTMVIRERLRGTLETVLASPASRLDLVAGYLCAAVTVSVVQAVITVPLGLRLSDIEMAASPWLLFPVIALCGVFGMSLGLAFSAVCRTEEQAAQMLPGLMVPQLMICGVPWPVAEMADWLQSVERYVPLSTVTRSMTATREHADGGTALIGNGIGMVAISVVALVCVAMVVRRRTA
ncbi:ABC transporter permease [Actinomadura meridiana]|uniref:Transport permease protein n=1 Tax=Actinomadura meridiana TaxID=559626 RepID=A0ABP8BS42_9ACTN